MPVSAPPSPLPARERSRLQTRARLLESGRKLFAERGIHGVTSHDVAAGAGVAAGTFYLHFKDKESLFRVIAEETIDLLRERLQAATRNAATLRDGVPLFAEALVGFAEENRDLVRILFSRDSEAAGIEADVLDELAAGIAENRRERAARGDHPADLDPEVLSQALVGLLSRVIAWWVEDPRRAGRETVIETLTRIQLSGTHPAEPR